MRDIVARVTPEQLRQAVLEDPDADEPRLAYADDADRRGDPRGEFIRLQIEYRAASREHRVTWEPSQRIKALRAAHDQEWLAPVKDLVDWANLLRGFVEHIEVSAAAYLRNADELVLLEPIRHLSLNDVRPVIGELAASPHLRHAVTLDLSRNGLDDDDLGVLLTSPHLGRVRFLNLGTNKITRAGVEALAASGALPALEDISVGSNPVDDPVDTYGYDWHMMGGVLPESISPRPFGSELEAKYGYLKWLHGPSLLPVYPMATSDV